MKSTTRVKGSSNDAIQILVDDPKEVLRSLSHWLIGTAILVSLIPVYYAHAILGARVWIPVNMFSFTLFVAFCTSIMFICYRVVYCGEYARVNRRAPRSSNKRSRVPQRQRLLARTLLHVHVAFLSFAGIFIMLPAKSSGLIKAYVGGSIMTLLLTYAISWIPYNSRVFRTKIY